MLLSSNCKVIRQNSYVCIGNLVISPTTTLLLKASKCYYMPQDARHRQRLHRVHHSKKYLPTLSCSSMIQGCILAPQLYGAGVPIKRKLSQAFLRTVLKQYNKAAIFIEDLPICAVFHCENNSYLLNLTKHSSKFYYRSQFSKTFKICINQR